MSGDASEQPCSRQILADQSLGEYQCLVSDSFVAMSLVHVSMGSSSPGVTGRVCEVRAAESGDTQVLAGSSAWSQRQVELFERVKVQRAVLSLL